MFFVCVLCVCGPSVDTHVDRGTPIPDLRIEHTTKESCESVPRLWRTHLWGMCNGCTYTCGGTFHGVFLLLKI